MTDELVLYSANDVNLKPVMTVRVRAVEIQLSPLCLASDKNVLMIYISKAHFLLLSQRFLPGYLFRLTERETLCCKVNAGNKPNNGNVFGGFCPIEAVLSDCRDDGQAFSKCSHCTAKRPADCVPVDFSLPSLFQLLAFLQGLFTFYHEGYELASEFEPYKQQLQFNLQNVSLTVDSSYVS